jgi:hypothetical protein
LQDRLDIVHGEPRPSFRVDQQECETAGDIVEDGGNVVFKRSEKGCCLDRAPILFQS